MRKNVLGIYFAARKNAILNMNLRPFLMKLLCDETNSKFCKTVISHQWTYLPVNQIHVFLTLHYLEIIYVNISTEFKSNKFDSSLIFFTFIEHKTSEFAAYHNTYLLYLTMRTMYSIHLHTCGESSCYDP